MIKRLPPKGWPLYISVECGGQFGHMERVSRRRDLRHRLVVDQCYHACIRFHDQRHLFIWNNSGCQHSRLFDQSDRSLGAQSSGALSRKLILRAAGAACS